MWSTVHTPNFSYRLSYPLIITQSGNPPYMHTAMSSPGPSSGGRAGGVAPWKKYSPPRNSGDRFFPTFHICLDAMSSPPPPPVGRDCLRVWSSRVCVTGQIQDPVPLIQKSRAQCPSGRFPPSFFHQVIITGLNKLCGCTFSPEDGLRCRQGVTPPLKLIK